MAILIGFGLRQDPKIKLLRDTANMWIDLWRDHPGLRADMRFAWRKAHAAIVSDSGKVQWHRVTGPVSATIASLTSQGWTVTTPEVWQDPHGDRWNIGNDGTKAEVEALIQAITAKQLWQQAAAGWQGAGLQAGLDDGNTLAWLKKLRKDGRHPEAGMLEALLCGGCWSPARVFQATSRSAEDCPQCGQANADDMHTYWTCPGHTANEQDAVKDTQYLVEAAQAGAEAAACLWLRGCLPSGFVEVSTPFVQQHGFKYHGPEAQQVQAAPSWPAGKIWTDASGGEFGNVDLLRRCSYGIVALEAVGEHYRISFGAYGPLPGEEQSVPRGELYSIVQAVERTCPLQPHVKSECLKY